MLALLGKKVFVFCGSYHYHGTVSAVNKDEFALSNPYIVYESGAWTNKTFTNAQALPTKELFIRFAAVESYFESGYAL